ncbi:alpha/beta fold hydrolase [Neorhizobium sp. DAR64861/K0K2]|uniref:alpha/beta fold hydrolase n=1 Tax=unclassified Neorhizobium TaxID=2629175 RepID=UPI003D2A02F0
MPFATIGSDECYYEITGQGPPLLLVTGLAGVASYWDVNVEALSRHCTVIRYDHRGTGRSTRSEQAYSVELLTDDLIGLMDALGIEKASLLGHSTGGAIGQVFGARYPERLDRMVLYASWATLCPQMMLCFDLRRLVLQGHGKEGYHRASPIFLYPPRFVSDEWPKLEKDMAAAIAGSTTETILDARIEAVISFNGLSYLPKISAPTLVLVAKDDILTPPLCSEELARNIPGATLQVLSYGGHAVSVCEPETFNQAVLSFLLSGHALPVSSTKVAS